MTRTVLKNEIMFMINTLKSIIDELNASCSKVYILSGSEDALVSPSVALAAVVSSSQDD